MSSLITLDGLTDASPDGRVLFENLTLAFGREKTGLVGRNGVGKTTLVRLMLGERTPAAGVVAVAGRLAVLRQQLAPPPGAQVADLLGVAEALAALARLEAGEGRDGDLETADWGLPVRIEAALAEVGLAGVALDRAADALSGGQLTRGALAALLVAEPDFILMDEPTNNLDAEGRAALAAMLERWRGGALVVSHDRALLRRMDRIVELTSLGANVYGGNYDLYAARKAEAEAAAARDLEQAEQAMARTGREIQQAKERKARSDARGKQLGAKGGIPRIVLGAMAEAAQNTGGRQNRLAERLRAEAERDLADAEARVERVRRLAFDLPPSGLPDGRLALAFEDVAFAWPDGTPVLADVSFRLTGPERVAVTGPNGAGKTTLIRLATGALEPTAGRVRRGVEAVVLDQRAALLRDDETLLANFRRLNPAADDNAAHSALARFVFRNVTALKPAGALSGGERLRAALACALMAARPPQLIILDEPTNHLDLDSIAAIEAALAAYDGALLVVSHDRDFLAAIGVEREVVLGR
ncbi:MAG TPA: ABC-F family ATP-binding cassette domain-containing protein [Caulobacteraceae bacterium]|jgi:ATPase subunit of ABC transporter with duplicated ATPase domains|nr:ABC-F family ATP-binding cassette domain-containing protein [Caulobacteraceae bacterium]